MKSGGRTEGFFAVGDKTAKACAAGIFEAGAYTIKRVNRTWFALMCLLMLYSASASCAIILIPEDVFKDYQSFVAGRDVGDIRDFSENTSRRDVIEVVLLIQALVEGGYQEPIRLRTSPSYAKTFRDLAAGKATLGGTTVWKRDAERLSPSVKVSNVIIKPGQFMVGVYTCQPDLNPPKTLQSLTQLRVVSNRQWSVDWKTLEAMGFTRLDSMDNWGSMVKMLCLGRADITLAPFPAGDELWIDAANYRLRPIEGIRIELLGSRHYPISGTADGWTDASRALARGLNVMEREHRFERAYRQSGFFNPAVEDWAVLNSLSNVQSSEAQPAEAPSSSVDSSLIPFFLESPSN